MYLVTDLDSPVENCFPRAYYSVPGLGGIKLNAMYAY